MWIRISDHKKVTRRRGESLGAVIMSNSNHHPIADKMPEKRFIVKDGKIIYIDEKTFEEREKRLHELYIKPNPCIKMVRCSICQITMTESNGPMHIQEFHSDLLRMSGMMISGSQECNNDDHSDSEEEIDVVSTAVSSADTGTSDFTLPENLIFNENISMELSNCNTEQPYDHPDEWSYEESEKRIEIFSGPDSGVGSNFSSSSEERDGFVDCDNDAFTKLSESSLSNIASNIQEPENEKNHMPTLLPFYNTLLESDNDRVNTFHLGFMHTLEKEEEINLDSMDSVDFETDSDRVAPISNSSSDDKEGDKPIKSHSVHTSVETLSSHSTERLLWCKICDNYYNSIYELKYHIRHKHKMDDSRVTRWNYATWDLEIARVFALPAVDQGV